MIVTAVSIEVDMERVLCLPHVLQFAFPALDEVDDVPRLAGCCCSYVVHLKKTTLVEMLCIY